MTHHLSPNKLGTRFGISSYIGSAHLGPPNFNPNGHFIIPTLGRRGGPGILK